MSLDLGTTTTDGLVIDPHFLSVKKAAALVRELRYVRWDSSRVVKQEVDGGYVVTDDASRVSRSAGQVWFNDALSRRVARIEERLCETFGVAPDHLESWQAVQYSPGGRFEAHLDGGSFGDEPAGERDLTFLLVLEAPARGGETYFPELDLLIEPTPGKLVVWPNLTPAGELDRRFLHAATPVREGRKTILTTWSRQRPVRPDVPTTPHRREAHR